MIRRAAVLLGTVIALAVPSAAVAQGSVYGVRGIGFPSRPLSARSRALGGGPAVFDRASPVNPAAAAGFPQLTAIAVSSTEYRGYEVDGTRVDGIRSTRFPMGLIGGRIGSRLGFSISFANYIERSFDFTSADTLMLRGVAVPVSDRIQSDGGIVDIRGAIAWAPVRSFRIGVAGHLISGSTKLRVRREFGDSIYRPFDLEGKATFAGSGVSAGMIWMVLPGLQVAGTARVDTRATTTIDSVPAGRFELPVSLAGGVELAPVSAIRWSATVQWRSWSDASGDLSPGELARNTLEFGTGLELGGAATGSSGIPLRLGFRWAQLPFSPSSEQPRELSLSIGTGLVFAGNRALLDAALERVFRDGAGVAERAWQVTVGMTVRP